MTRRCVAAARKALAAGAGAAGISAAVRSAVEEAGVQPAMGAGSPSNDAEVGSAAGGEGGDGGGDGVARKHSLASMPSFRDEGQLGIIGEDEEDGGGD